MTNEKVQFRLFQMPCCRHQLCWINPRYPTYCPECSAFVHTQLRAEIEHTLIDATAWLKVGQ
jgi:hypothetical protein